MVHVCVSVRLKKCNVIKYKCPEWAEIGLKVNAVFMIIIYPVLTSRVDIHCKSTGFSEVS